VALSVLCCDCCYCCTVLCLDGGEKAKARAKCHKYSIRRNAEIPEQRWALLTISSSSLSPSYRVTDLSANMRVSAIARSGMPTREFSDLLPHAHLHPYPPSPNFRSCVSCILTMTLTLTPQPKPTYVHRSRTPLPGPRLHIRTRAD